MNDIGHRWVEYDGEWYVLLSDKADRNVTLLDLIRDIGGGVHAIDQKKYRGLVGRPLYEVLPIYRHWSKVDVVRIDPDNPPSTLRYRGREYHRVAVGRSRELDLEVLHGAGGGGTGWIVQIQKGENGSEGIRVDAPVVSAIYREPNQTSEEPYPNIRKSQARNIEQLRKERDGFLQDISKAADRIEDLERENERLKSDVDMFRESRDRHEKSWMKLANKRNNTNEFGPSAALSAKPVQRGVQVTCQSDVAEEWEFNQK